MTRTPQTGRQKDGRSVSVEWKENSRRNDTNDTNPEEAISCIALSKNDSYVTSISGGKVSLFNDNDTYADDVIMKVMVAFHIP